MADVRPRPVLPNRTDRLPMATCYGEGPPSQLDRGLVVGISYRGQRLHERPGQRTVEWRYFEGDHIILFDFKGLQIQRARPVAGGDRLDDRTVDSPDIGQDHRIIVCVVAVNRRPKLVVLARRGRAEHHHCGRRAVSHKGGGGDCRARGDTIARSDLDGYCLSLVSLTTLTKVEGVVE